LIQQCRPLLPNAKWVQTYACTEAASSLTFYECTTTTTTTATNNNNKNDNVDCVGTPPAHVQLQLKHARPPPHDMLVNQPYQTGIIGTRGPHVMNGYWVRGARAPKDDYSQKWFWTTDLGYFDAQGRLHFQGRLHHVVRTGGETVHCQAVERALQEIHGECAVFGLPDDYYGERVCAAFTNPTITLELVKETCKKAGLAGYKHPKQVFVVHSLPRNSSGKVLYYKLVEQLGTPATSKL
jgi:acyl-CoA synthetase (AMP-forming)/AMP-acid ligase II